MLHQAINWAPWVFFQHFDGRVLDKGFRTPEFRLQGIETSGVHMRDRQKVGLLELYQTRNRACPLEKRELFPKNMHQILFGVAGWDGQISWQNVFHAAAPGTVPQTTPKDTRIVHQDGPSLCSCLLLLEVLHSVLKRPDLWLMQLEGLGISVVERLLQA